MSRRVSTGESTKEFKKSPSLTLTTTEGHFVKGVFQQAVKDPTYPNKFNYLISVSETNAPTTLWNKEEKKEEEVDIEEGDNVFLRGFTRLAKAIEELNVQKGDVVTITYTGLGTAKKGQKKPFLCKVEVE